MSTFAGYITTSNTDEAIDNITFPSLNPRQKKPTCHEKLLQLDYKGLYEIIYK